MRLHVNEFDFLNSDVETAARNLLGCVLEREVEGRILKGRIIEVEAYDESDAASHSYKGETKRTQVMFGPPGHLYVYFTYGMHYCCNVVIGAEGVGAAVLIRAVEPIDGQDIMIQNRGGRKGTELTNGPAKLCQAFGIDLELNGHDLSKPPLRLMRSDKRPNETILVTPRIGISKAVETPWRFILHSNLLKTDTTV